MMKAFWRWRATKHLSRMIDCLERAGEDECAVDCLRILNKLANSIEADTVNLRTGLGRHTAA